MFPPVAVVPLTLFPIVMAYQADFAYGNKADRIKEEADKILVHLLTFNLTFTFTFLSFFYPNCYLFPWVSNQHVTLNRMKKHIGSQSRDSSRGDKICFLRSNPFFYSSAQKQRKKKENPTLLFRSNEVVMIMEVGVKSFQERAKSIG